MPLSINSRAWRVEINQLRLHPLPRRKRSASGGGGIIRQRTAAIRVRTAMQGSVSVTHIEMPPDVVESEAIF